MEEIEPECLGGLSDTKYNNNSQWPLQHRVDDSEKIDVAITTAFNPKYLTKENKTIHIKEATKKGYTECEVGGVFNAAYPESDTRRGRVLNRGAVAPTLTTSGENILKVEPKYRIRKLTPLECFRLMGVTDSDAKKILAVNSNSQCYKQAGNSIVVDVMAAMFKKLF